MNDTVTILGRVGGDPNRGQTTGGVPVVNFRVASPQRRYDAKSASWIETGTNWYNVSAFRQLAEHAKASLRSGDGVIITGRLKLREWESGGKKGMSADIDAEAIGHDLRWGASAFIKVPSSSSSHVPSSEAQSADLDVMITDDGVTDADAASSDGDSGDHERELTPTGGAWG